MDEHDPTSQLPRHTTPTWEVELLISGVAVFAMLQLPGWLDDAMFSLRPRLDDSLQMLLMMVYVYAKGAVLILALTFVLHLLLRARWIALVGLHSVYPDGIRWEKLRIGPILRDLERARQRPFPEIVERADNLATTVFAVGVMLALFIVLIAAMALLVAGVAVLLSSLSGGRFGVVAALLALLAIVVVPFSLASLLDRELGARIARGSLRYRLLQRVLRLYARAGFSGTQAMALLASHAGDRKVRMATTGLIFLAFVIASLSLVAQESPNRLGDYGLFPSGAALRNIDDAHYDDQRDPARDAAVPYVQSIVVAGPYLKLVVPFRPGLDEPAMRRRCPQATAAKGDGLAEARLACLQSLHGVVLDGKSLDPRYEPGSDPRTDRPALVAMIDLRDLPRGRHELRVAYPREPGRQRRDDPGFDRIPFWK
jgi:hypothetical protein